jgi:hypothetical protein
LALLGIGKKKEPEAAKEEVPEELPDLPKDEGAAEAAPEQAAEQPAEQEGGVPDELPDAGDLSPDELSPIPSGEPSIDTNAKLETDPLDRKLYFSQLLQKFHEDGLKSTKLVSPSADLLSDMKKFWKEKKKSEQLDAMRQKIKIDIEPLQKLEKEWADLREDIEQKKKLLREKEKSIQSLVEELKTLARKTERAGPGKR